ncbi:hypothetical protein RB595_010568 [Gaeumannomyces hyphopodioides]
MAPKNNGITAHNPPQGTDVLLVVIFATMALYNVIELAFIIPITFKRRSGNYFWFFVLATGSIVPYSVGFILKGLNVLPQAIYLWVLLTFVGWCGMILFQSLVLWSRLRFVVHSPRCLRAVLYMIIFNAVICDVPVAVLVFGSNSSNPDPFATAYSIFESIQVTIFAIQELLISLVYIRETAKLLRLEKANAGTFNLPARRQVMTHLIYVSIIVVLLDIPTMALQFSEQYATQTAYKAFAYSIKLKLEFSILNRLVDVCRNRNASAPQPLLVYTGDSQPMNIAVASSLSPADPNLSKSRNGATPAINHPLLPRLPRFSRPFGRSGDLEDQNGAGDAAPVDPAMRAGSGSQAIQVTVETQVTIETSDSGNQAEAATSEKRAEAKEAAGHAEGAGGKGKAGIQKSEEEKPERGEAEVGADQHSARPPRPHPSESLTLPNVFSEREADP